MNHWRTKLAAWLHDPAEKALILLRDKTGHEWGTVAKLREDLFGSRAIPADIQPILKRADWYAAAADRPQWPLEENSQRYAPWTQVDFASHPVLIHPLTGKEYDLGNLADIEPEHLKSVSHNHFASWIVRCADGTPDLQKTLLAYWRFGPTTPAPDLHHLWRNLPADTRVPDHSIWSHLDLVSAFAGAMSLDATGTPALLSVSLGPVQGFIAEARTTSDLWAGSHLLARIAWEGMKVICERLGPDALLFPQLRGVPLVDVWLRDKIGLPTQWFDKEVWNTRKTDTNPLFAAALPNRFVAIVPADRAAEMGTAITQRVREFMVKLGDQTLRAILQEINEDWQAELPCVTQMENQLKGFPEVHWATTPWSLVENAATPGARSIDTNKIRLALTDFYPLGAAVGFLESEVWQVLSRDIELGGAKFHTPNPGVLYPALYDLLDRVAAAAKTIRPFEQLGQPQVGYRSTLNGEREWLTLDRSQLDTPSGSRDNTLWTRLASERPSWVKPGEHLDALNAIKRLWPTIFIHEVSSIVGREVKRYVVSTHTLALAVSLEQWLDKIPRTDIPFPLRNLLESLPAERTALPRRIDTRLNNDSDAQLLCRRLPGVLDALKDRIDTDTGDEKGRHDARQAEEMLLNVEHSLRELFDATPETYYGLLLFDGDRMGAWLAGSTWKDTNDQIIDPRLTYEKCWHPRIRESDAVRNFRNRNPALKAYLTAKRPPSPGRHGAISEALNHFSLKTARFVVEDCFKGKLIYAGGDDVLAFVCVDDLLPAMTLLRCLYSGRPIPTWLDNRLDDKVRARFKSDHGWLYLEDELLLTMGEQATASCGAVVAHHQAPLGMVLRALREAEGRAKHQGGRDAFTLRILKRAGGEVGVTDRWFQGEHGAAGLLDQLMRMLARPEVSRRASYHSIEWLTQLPEKPDPELLKMNLAYQFNRQKADPSTACLLVDYVSRHHPDTTTNILCDFLMTAEFLARNTRHRENA